MRPLRLEFKGINSFSDYTVIDFSPLTKNGIFGIFGDTGSGKSTILDCINFALYGKVERSNDKTDIINYRCKECSVTFSFDILSDGIRKVYTVKRLLKRDKAGTHKAELYENDGLSEVCIAEKTTTVSDKITEILGVQLEDFRKCIALPQGEFSQFVKAAKGERLALIERLFSLSKYGDRLKDKISDRLRTIEAEYQNLSGKLSVYNDVDGTVIKNLETTISEENKKSLQVGEELSKLVAECDRLKTLVAKRGELNESELQLNRLLSRKEQMDKLRNDISRYPACKNVAESDAAYRAKAEEYKKIQEQSHILCEKLKEEINKTAKLEAELSEADFDGQISELIKRGAVYKSCEGLPQKLKKLGEELERKRAYYKAKDEDIKKLSSDKILAEKAVIEAEKKVKDFNGFDVEKFLNGEFKGAVLKDELVNQLGYFADLKSGIKIYNDDSALYGFVEKQVSEKIEEYKSRIYDIKDFNIGKTNLNLTKLKEDQELKEKLLNILAAKREAVQKIEASLQVKITERETLKRDGEELKNRYKETHEEIKKAVGEDCVDIFAAIKETEKKAEELKIKKREITENIENSKGRKNILEVQLEKCRTLEQTGMVECERLVKEKESLLKQSGFDNVESCLKLCKEFDGLPDAENTLKEYDKQRESLTQKIAELKCVEGIDNVSEAGFAEACKTKTTIEGELKAITENIAVLKANLLNANRRLDEKNSLSKEFKIILDRKNLIERLREITKNNKFLEFIANEYLFDISKSASVTLLKLTDGRYFLTYKDNNFFVGDNFDCGNLRGVNTLSGGETFLVSLSLALSLSQTICSRSSKSIEFFFLDEGFGTLDATLVDTVMSALEKLKSSHFTIGIISHVEELKHRIDSKITVNKATESRGSFVEVSC